MSDNMVSERHRIAILATDETRYRLNEMWRERQSEDRLMGVVSELRRSTRCAV
jgi:hypothetical protein